MYWTKRPITAVALVAVANAFTFPNSGWDSVTSILPSSVQAYLQTAGTSVFSRSLASELSAGSTPPWFASLPSSIKTELVPAATATSTKSNTQNARTSSGIRTSFTSSTTSTSSTSSNSLPAASTDPPTRSSRHSIDTGAIAGGVVGGIVGLAAIVILAFFLGRRSTHEKTASEKSDTTGSENSSTVSDFVRRGLAPRELEGQGKEELPGAHTHPVEMNSVKSPIDGKVMPFSDVKENGGLVGDHPALREVNELESNPV